ncbi:EscU/YscU/HrcU family type III secretion system export apparatus switch protein [Georgenia subflava]|uniref:Flagellar type III secretion system protein FlhB n=1 Tax=Georgenia subflava TaxID=1622177 RepID=A0A6N7ELS2_9MICO|nr:EscU/YscU/HrcU family type III secretion system export apparatus switch protein [Georgenia subflava]MPV39069.1 flagellar type III secretion system protein FlhB [Georgenia subflava]
MSSSAQEKTEQATPQRMKKVRDEGGLGRSQDLSAWLVVGAAALALPAAISAAADAGREQVHQVRNVVEAPETATAVQALSDGLGSVLLTLVPVLAAAALAAIIGSAAQGGVHVSGKRLKPKFTNFNLVKGLKRILGPQAWWQGAKALLKTLVVGAVLYLAIAGMVPLVLRSGTVSLSQVIGEVGDRVASLFIWAVVAGLALAVLDVVVVIRRNRKQTRMSRQEVKEENKSSEGDPHVKGQRRALQLAMSRNRMMAAVADADVVVVNPTHVAVALRYQPGEGAPRVVAKGQGHIAAKIRERAAEHHVTVVQDITLARTLNAACEIGHEVPEHLYEAVARVLAFVMSLRRRGAAAGTHRVPPPGKARQ